MDVNVALRLSVFSDSTKKSVDLEVQTHDVGPQKTGGVHLWNKKTNEYVDVPLTKSATIGSDDVFKGHVDLPDGLDPATLSATAWVDVPQQNGTQYRIWEQTDHDVEARGQDRLRTISPSAIEGKSTLSTHAASGRVEVDLVDYSFNDYPDFQGQRAVTAIRLLPADPTAFAGVSEMKALVMPQVRFQEEDWLDAHRDEIDFMDLNEGDFVTLKKQSDGSFVANAPVGQAWVLESTFNFGEGHSTRYANMLQVALKNPMDSEWDNNGGGNYSIAVPDVLVPNIALPTFPIPGKST